MVELTVNVRQDRSCPPEPPRGETIKINLYNLDAKKGFCCLDKNSQEFEHSLSLGRGVDGVKVNKASISGAYTHPHDPLLTG